MNEAFDAGLVVINAEMSVASAELLASGLLGADTSLRAAESVQTNQK